MIVRIQLTRTDIPVGELAVLAGDERVEQRCGNERVDASGPRRITVEVIFRHPLVGVAVRPDVQSVRALPAECLVVGDEGPRERAYNRCLCLHLRRVTRRRRGWPELAGESQQQWLPVRGGHVARVGALPVARSRRHRSRPHRVRAIGLRLRNHQPRRPSVRARGPRRNHSGIEGPPAPVTTRPVRPLPGTVCAWSGKKYASTAAAACAVAASSDG